VKPQANTEPQAWIIVANRPNMERCAKLGVFGLTRQELLSKVAIGDHIVAYILREIVFSGIGKVTQEHYLDDIKLFEGGLYPERIGIELKLLPAAKSLNVWDVIGDLAFASNKIKWPASLAGGIRRIPLADFELIAKRLNHVKS